AGPDDDDVCLIDHGEPLRVGSVDSGQSAAHDIMLPAMTCGSVGAPVLESLPTSLFHGMASCWARLHTDDVVAGARPTSRKAEEAKRGDDGNDVAGRAERGQPEAGAGAGWVTGVRAGHGIGSADLGRGAGRLGGAGARGDLAQPTLHPDQWCTAGDR